jgi:hypothetical protein
MDADGKFDSIAREIDALVDTIETYLGFLDKNPDVQKTLIAYFKVKNGYDIVDAARKRLYAVKDRMDKGIIPGMLEKAGVDKVAVPDVARSFYTVTKYSASIVDKELGFKWLQDHGASELITETVNAGTLASFFKDWVLENGMDPPEDTFKFNNYKTTGMSKYTPK